MKTHSNKNSRSEKAFSWYIEKTIAHFKHLKERFPNLKNSTAIETVLKWNKSRKFFSATKLALLLILSALLIGVPTYNIFHSHKKINIYAKNDPLTNNESLNNQGLIDNAVNDSLDFKTDIITNTVDSIKNKGEVKDYKYSNGKRIITNDVIIFGFFLFMGLIPIFILFRLYYRGFFYWDYLKEIDVRLSYLKNFKEIEELNIGQISDYIKSESRDELFKKATTPPYNITDQRIIDLILNLIKNELKGKKQQITRLGYLVFELSIITFEDNDITELQKLLVWQEVVCGEASDDSRIIKDAAYVKKDGNDNDFSTKNALKLLAGLLMKKGWKNGANKLYELIEGMNSKKE